MNNNITFPRNIFLDQWCTIYTWWHSFSGSLLVLDDTIVLKTEKHLIKLQKLGTMYTLSKYKNRFTDEISEKLFIETIPEIIHSFPYNRNLEKIFEHSYVVLFSFKGKNYMLKYDLSKGFIELPEDSWHISDLLKYKQRNPNVWKNEFYLPENL